MLNITSKLDLFLHTWQINNLFTAKYDINNCMLYVIAGAGGTEACDWAKQILQMYYNWLKDNNYKYSLIDIQEGDVTGIKSACVLIEGDYSYGYLKNERGNHRLQRVSPYGGKDKRHTSFCGVEVEPIIVNSQLTINPKDLIIDTFRSGGKGGQNVNKVETAIRITHIPTGIAVKCQETRSQHENKQRALKLLTSRLQLIKDNDEFTELQSTKEGVLDTGFGSRIRTYSIHPYTLVKDDRTECQTSDVYGFLEGKYLTEFILENLKIKTQNSK